MSDPKPKDEEIEARAAEGDAGESPLERRPPKDLPEELVMGRLGRLDTRRALAELCKSVPGLDEVLLPRGIRADALTRKSGGGAALLRGVARRIAGDPAAWGAFRAAVQEQIPPETFEALGSLSGENLEEMAEAHTTEGLLLAALTTDEEQDPAVVGALTESWRLEKGAAQKKASEDAHVRDLEAELERLKGENERLSFASRAANERAAALAEEVDVLTGERSGASELVRKAEEQAASALDARGRLDERIAELERRGEQLERALEGERTAYARAAERVDELHEELGRVAAERDRIKNALQNARFTDDGFGELLVRAVKNEVGAMPASLDSAASTAHLLEFMGKVLQAQSDLRAPRTQATKPTEEEAEDPDPSPAPPPVVAPEVRANGSRNGGHARSRPTLSFRALGGAGEVGGSSHLLDFGSTRVLVDAGIKPDGRGPAAPNFGAIDRIDAAVITHAHLDHCGALPLLVRDRPGLPIYCTPPSAKLIVSALNDHAAMGGGLPGGAPIHEVRKRLVPVPFGKPLKIGDATVTLTESGHILGAASVLLQSGPATVFHTGDICMEDHFSIPSARLPDVKDIDLLIMEATLADQKPQPFSDSIRTMVETINETTMERERGGSVLIPTYALGQAQEIILGLKHYGKEYGLDRDVFIYVDGSVVTTSERLYAEQLGYMKPYLQHSDPREIFFSDNIRAVANDDNARERILTNPCAVIASPVTMQGGASAFYRRRLEGDAKNAVILPSNAAASYGAQRDEEARWRVERVSFAAHCTQDELLGITKKLSPRQIILIHGSRRRISDLAFRLAPDHKIHTPTVGETVRTVL